MRSRIAVLTLLLLSGSRIAHGLEANLAKADPGTTQTLSVPAGAGTTVTIVNMAPGNRYAKALIIRNIEVTALPAFDADGAGAPDQCDELTELEEVTEEVKVPGLVSALEKAVAVGTCDEARADELIGMTRETMDGPVPLHAGQELVLTVERQPDSERGVEKAVWTFVWTTGPRGEWRASYGFGFFESDDEKYFTRPGEEEGTFVIKREADRRDLVFAPAVFFTWAREAKKLGNWDHGPAGGLGFDLSKPVVFAGWQVTYNQNYTLNLGLVARPEKELDGQYEPDQVLKEDLKEDQLHDDSSYGVALFGGLSFRFTTNPFQKSGGDEK